MQHLRAQALPLLAFTVEAVHVKYDRLADHSWNISEWTVRDIAQQDDVVVAEGDMHRCEESADPCVEMFPVQTGNDDAADAGIVDIVRSGEGLAISTIPASAASSFPVCTGNISTHGSALSSKRCMSPSATTTSSCCAMSRTVHSLMFHEWSASRSYLTWTASTVNARSGRAWARRCCISANGCHHSAPLNW